MTLTIESAARGFAAAGSDSRLAVLQLLVRAGSKGLSVGEIQEKSGIPASTLAHHIRTLAEAGLVTQARSGRSTINRAEFDNLRSLADFLLEECCADSNGESDCKHSRNSP